MISDPVKVISQYASRYTVVAAPLLLLISEKYSRLTYWKVFRMSVGGAIGLLSLASYFGMLGM